MGLFHVLVKMAQILIVPLGTFIAVVSTKAYRRSRMLDFKIEALTYAIERELANNGFTTKYREKLEELINEYRFINKK